MEMLTLNGRIINVYQTPGGSTKDGKRFESQDRVQFQCENLLQNGQVRIELIDLNISRPEPFKALLNKPVSIPVGVFVSSGRIVYFAHPAAQPKEVK